MTTIKRAVWLLAMVVGITVFVRAAPEKKKKPPDAKPSNAFQLTVQEPASTIVPDDFTLVVLPDAQFYTANKNGGKSEMLVAQTEWIVSNRVSRNIAFVTTEGDISNDGGKINAQWERATNALYRLENPARTGLPDGIPYSAVVGNHDAHYGGTAKFNEYFGTSHFVGRRYYGGHCSTNNDSHYDFFSAGGHDFIVLSLTMDAGSDSNLMSWANSVLHSNARRSAIVVTHSLLNPEPWPKPATWTKEGPAIFESLTNNANLFLMLCGHRHGEGRRHESIGNGRWLDVVLADYQNYMNGGNGFMRLMEFSPAHRTIRVKTFSPWTGQWATNSASFFTLAWPPAGAP